MEHFYVTLPSNSSYAYYGKQPMSHFKTKLARQLHVNVGEWEVGLAEFIYPISWHNVLDGTFSVRKLIDNKWGYVDGKIPASKYESAAQLIETLETAIRDILGNQNEHIAFTILHTRHVKIFIENGYALHISQNLAQVLGFGDRTCTLSNASDISQDTCDITFQLKNLSLLSPFVADVNRGLRSLFIHCNIVQPQLVGDQYVPLIRTVAVTGKTDDVVANSFSNIHYMSIERSTFQEIEIHITDDIGRTVPFQHGRVIVKLHFKRK